MPVDLSSLTEGQQVEGFRVEALYVDGGDRAVGVRLQHLHTGLTLRMFLWDTVPQSYLWFNTVPSSDRGEPHTQEHLLLGKGNRGRAVATMESMTLTESSAFTEQNRTVYHFSTTGGSGVFFDVFEARLRALLEPDYLDEEIRREVHHWGVTEEVGADGNPTRILEEKGTVYNEMDSSMQQPGWVLWSRMPKDLYGEGHPMAFESGGTPEGLRDLAPDRIRTFHAEHYQLPNAGAIVFLPMDTPVESALDRFDATLVRLQPEPTKPGVTFLSEETLPPPQSSPDRSVRELRYPNGDDTGPATLMLAWPPRPKQMPLAERYLASLLLSGIAGPENSNLYKALIDSRTRERDIEATSVSAFLTDDPGQPLYMSVGGLPSQRTSDEDMLWLARRLLRELETLAALPPGDPALLDLRRRLEASLVSWRRSTRDSLTGPPGFGVRGTGSGWHDHLVDIDREGGFRRPLLAEPQLAWVEQQIAREDNPWAQWIRSWGLLEEVPFIYVNRPSSAALAALTEAKQGRVAEKLAALKAEAKIDDEQAVLNAFAQRYAADTAALEAAVQPPSSQFLSAPPLTPDPELRYEVRDIQGIPLVVGHFGALPGAKTALMLDLGATDPKHALWLSVLPRLLSEVGVIEDGAPVSHEEVIERTQREILSAGAYSASNASTGRIELALHASGTDPEETRAALRWARTFLASPDWRPENLPRIRDVVDEALDAARRRMQTSEEYWASNPPLAWEHQDQHLQLHLWSFLTYEYDLLRLRYRLMPSDLDASRRLADLGGAARVLGRADLKLLLAKIRGDDVSPPKAAAPWLREPAPEALRDAAGDLEVMLAKIPDASLAADFEALCRRLAADLAERPEDALSELAALRDSALSRSGARMYAAGGALLDSGAIDADLNAWSALLPEGPRKAPAPRLSQPLRARIAARGGRGDAVHVGLIEPNRRSGVIHTSAPLHTLTDLDESSLLDDLSVRTLSGGGAHSLFIRTWGAGLAYSNGSSAREASGRMAWSADRCPKIGQTLGFVIDTLKATPIDKDIAEYAVASVFYSRADGAPESRTASIAADLTDQLTPEVHRAFRSAVLAMRGREDLASQLAERAPIVYGRLLPGFGAPSRDVPGALSFAIGDQGQLTAWGEWLAASEGDAATFEVLYPRDFWLTDPSESGPETQSPSR